MRFYKQELLVQAETTIYMDSETKAAQARKVIGYDKKDLDHRDSEGGPVEWHRILIVLMALLCAYIAIKR